MKRPATLAAVPERMFNRRHQTIWAGAVLIASSFQMIGVPNEPSATPVYERDIRPILKTYCFHCHGEGEKLRGGVDLRLRRLIANKQTESGIVLVPGHPDQSLMLTLVRSGEMPQGEKKLTEKHIALIQQWIAAGAPTAREEPPELPRGFQITEEERRFWAFQPIRRPPIPKAKSSVRVRTAVDSFIWTKLRELGLEFAPEADRTTLIRRVYFDLTGLPPSPETIEAFLADDSPGAYERLVDRVLDLPEYGERWGRHWLDVAGYADSNGYAEADSLRSHAWHYRDYVIQAFNSDKRWDDFIVEQLAGDELAKVTQENAATKATDPRVQELLTATGYLRMAPDGTGDEVPDQNLARNQVVAETIKVVSSSLLGLTVGCAQCHDHRYDPISQKDYYRFRAIFEPAFDWKHWRVPSERLVSLYTADDRKKAEEIEAEARKIDEAARQMRKDFLEKVFEKELAKLPEQLKEVVQAARNTAREKRSAEQTAILKQYPSADVQGALDLYDPEANKKVQAKQEEATQLRTTKPPEPFLMAVTEPTGRIPETFVFNRGDHEQPKDKVEPGELEIIQSTAVDPPSLANGKPTAAQPNSQGLLRSSASSPTAASEAIPNEITGDGVPKRAQAPDGLSGSYWLSQLSSTNASLQTSGRRLAYARWLTSGSHPLVARVLVNRFWMEHFGRGLVGSPGDFGQLGDKPSHPELLDWLASEFAAGGWRLKSFHRLLMTSTVYRQAVVNESAQRVDPDNQLYARMRPRRLKAETLRDSILAVSGSLNQEAFGPALPLARDGAGRVLVGQQKFNGGGDPTIVESIGDRAHRRSVYVAFRRSLPLTVLEAFDEPVMAPNCEVRVSSTVSPQALMMLNDTFVLEQAQRFAERLCREFPGNLRAQIDRAWRLAYGNAPSDREELESLVYVAEQGESIRSRHANAAPSKKPDAPKATDKPAPQVLDTQTQALASLCQALLASNRFLYVD